MKPKLSISGLVLAMIVWCCVAHSAQGGPGPVNWMAYSSDGSVLITTNFPLSLIDFQALTTGGATNGIQQLNGKGTNTTLYAATLNATQGYAVPTTANTNYVPVGPYDTVTGGAGNFGPSSGETAFEWIVTGHNYRIRQDGTVTQAKLYLDSTTGLSSVYFEIWRANSTTSYSVVGRSEDILPQLTAGATNLVTFASPIAGVLEGDYTGVLATYTAASVQNWFALTGVTMPQGSIAPVTYSSTTAVSTNAFDWTTKTANSGTVVVTEAYMQAPVFVTIGDSIIAGFPNTLSFLATAPSGNPTNWVKTNSIAWQVASRIGSVTYQNMGVPGDTTYGILNRLTNDVINLHPKWVLLEGGINDIQHATNVVDTETNIINTLDALNAAGIQVVHYLVFPQGANVANVSPNRIPVNQFIRTEPPLFGNLVVEDAAYVGTNTVLGTDADGFWMQSFADSGDHLHLSLNGAIAVSEAAVDRIKTASPIVATTGIPSKGSASSSVFASDGTNLIAVGYDSALGSAMIQSRSTNSGYTALSLNPYGGNVGVGTRGPAPPYTLSSGGTLGSVGGHFSSGGVYSRGASGPVGFGWGNAIGLEQSGNMTFLTAASNWAAAYAPLTIRAFSIGNYISGSAAVGQLIENSGNQVLNESHSMLNNIVNDWEIRENYRDDTGLLANTNYPSYTFALGRLTEDNIKFYRAPSTTTTPVNNTLATITADGDLKMLGSGWFPGYGGTTITNGSGVNVLTIGTNGYVDSFNKDLTRYNPLNVRAHSIQFYLDGSSSQGIWMNPGGGMQIMGQSTVAQNGGGLDLLYNGSVFMDAIDHNGTVWKNMTLRGLTVNLDASGSLEAFVDSNGFHSTVASFSPNYVATNYVDAAELRQSGTKILTAGQHLTNIADIASSSAVAMTLSGTNVSAIGSLDAPIVTATNQLHLPYVTASKVLIANAQNDATNAVLTTGTIPVASTSGISDGPMQVGAVTNVAFNGGITSDNVHATNGVTSGNFVFKQVSLTQGVSPLVDSTNQTLDFAQGMYQIWTLTNDICLNAFSGSPSAATIKFRANGGNRNVLISTNWMPLNVQGGTANGSYYQFILTNGTQFSTLSAWATGANATNVAAVWANF